MLPPDVRFKGQNAPKSISARGPLWRSLPRFPNPLTGFKGATSKGREREENGGRGRGQEGREGEGPPPCVGMGPQRLFQLCSSFKYAVQKYFEMSQNNARNVF